MDASILTKYQSFGCVLWTYGKRFGEYVEILHKLYLAVGFYAKDIIILQLNSALLCSKMTGCGQKWKIWALLFFKGMSLMKNWYQCVLHNFDLFG